MMIITCCVQRNRADHESWEEAVSCNMETLRVLGRLKTLLPEG